MSDWMRTNIDFGAPMALLILDWREAVSNNVRDVLNGDPAWLASFMEKFIVNFRPELAGGSIVTMNCNYSRACWEFWYAHPSLPRQRLGMEPERIPLIPEIEQSHAVSGPIPS